MTRRLTKFALCSTLALLVGVAGCSSDSPSNSDSSTAGQQPAATSSTEPEPGQEPGLGDTELDPAVKDLTILVVGDSMAHAYGQGMINAVTQAADAEGTPRNVTVVNAAMGGCGLMQPFMQPVDGVMEPTYSECNKWPETWAGLVDQYKPDFAYLSSSFWDVAPQILEEDGPEVTIAEPAVQDHWLAQADKAIGVLSASGATVFFDDGNSDGMHDVQRRAVAAHPENTKLLNLRAEMCSDTECPPVIDGVKVLDDTGHPAGESQLRLATWLLNQMVAESNSGE